MSGKRRIRNFQGRSFRGNRKQDILTRQKRSILMSRIRSSGSKMETMFVANLRSRCKHRFKVNDHTVFGKPDIVFHNSKVCVFLDSDFWHGWQYSRWKHLLKTDFWRTKIQRNRERDRKVTRKLRHHGWKVLRIWEHNLREGFENEIVSIKSLIRNQKVELFFDRNRSL